MFRIGDSDIHSVGWIATCDIPADTPILDEEVSIRMPLDLSSEYLGNPKQLEERVSKLPDSQRSSLLALYGNSLLDKLWMNGTPLIDVAVDPLGIGPQKELGIYLKCAWLNHSCVPNAARASDKGNIMSVVAQKDIAEGEEITISYMDDNLVEAKDREKQMRSKIRVGKFWQGCHCPLCTGPQEVRNASDKRRLRLFSYRERLLQGRLPEQVLVTEFLPLLTAEGLSMSLIGTRAVLKLMNLLLGVDATTTSEDTLNTLSFPKQGTRVVLHKLKAKPQLNGKMGSVVCPLNPTTGRVGVLLLEDSGMEQVTEVKKRVLAVKPENLCVVQRDPEGMTE